MIEDTTTTGAAFVESIVVMREAGFKTLQAISLVDRSEGVVEKKMADLGLSYTAIVTTDELVQE